MNNTQLKRGLLAILMRLRPPPNAEARYLITRTR